MFCRATYILNKLLFSKLANFKRSTMNSDITLSTKEGKFYICSSGWKHCQLKRLSSLTQSLPIFKKRKKSQVKYITVITFNSQKIGSVTALDLDIKVLIGLISKRFSYFRNEETDIRRHAARAYFFDHKLHFFIYFFYKNV